LEKFCTLRIMSKNNKIVLLIMKQAL